MVKTIIFGHVSWMSVGDPCKWGTRVYRTFWQEALAFMKHFMCYVRLFSHLMLKAVSLGSVIACWAVRKYRIVAWQIVSPWHHVKALHDHFLFPFQKGRFLTSAKPTPLLAHCLIISQTQFSQAILRMGCVFNRGPRPMVC